jgi:regulator of ribonuclease activity A
MPTDPTSSPSPDVPATADIYDEYGDNLQSCDTQFRQYGGTRSFGGTIVTIKSFEDNVLVKEAVQEPGDGRVLVIDGGGSLHVALLGDHMAQFALDSGWSGLIVNGAVRDAAILATLPIGVKALGSNPRKSSKRRIGERDVPVQFGGLTFTPGATLYPDDDGIVVLPA